MSKWNCSMCVCEMRILTTDGKEVGHTLRGGWIRQLTSIPLGRQIDEPCKGGGDTNLLPKWRLSTKEGAERERERESEILNSITMPMKLSHACLLIISDDITLRVSTVITHWVGPKRGHILRVVAVPCALCPGSCRHAPLGVGTTGPSAEHARVTYTTCKLYFLWSKPCRLNLPPREWVSCGINLDIHATTTTTKTTTTVKVKCSHRCEHRLIDGLVGEPIFEAQWSHCHIGNIGTTARSGTSDQGRVVRSVGRVWLRTKCLDPSLIYASALLVHTHTHTKSKSSLRTNSTSMLVLLLLLFVRRL